MNRNKLLLTLMWIALGAGCAGGGDDGGCVDGFGCTPIATDPTAGSPGGATETGEAATEGFGSTEGSDGEAPYCDESDRKCVGDDALQYCDESGDELRTVSCQAACGMEQVSLGCADDDGEAGCVCGEPPGTSGDEDTTGGGVKCDDFEYPTPCPEMHGVPAGCYPVDVACQTMVECPFGVAACSDPEYAVDCSEGVCVPIQPGLETTNYLCSNGLDDDGSGTFDCDDPSCRMQNVTVCNGESTDHECANGMDDDGDGYVDCADYDCRYSPAVTKCPQFEWRDSACANAVDDDGDDYVDCDDSSCYSAFSFVCW